MLNVTSEVGQLRAVLVHEPGEEVDRMAPSMMDELLFDDILFGDRAREEHRLFQRLLQLLGVEVVEAGQLLVETLADAEAVDWLWRIVQPELEPALRDRPADMAPDEIAAALVAGILDEAAHDCVEVTELFRLAPLPNWCFQRDPQVVVGDSVVFGAMATQARWREGLLARAVFRYHPRLRSLPVILDPLHPEPVGNGAMTFHRPSLEGGDVLVLSEQVLAVGISERTNPVGVEALARALARRDEGPRWLEVVELPHRRAYMHLDTVFTPIDVDAALVFPAVIGSSSREAAACFEIDLHAADLVRRPRSDLLATLSARGVDLEPISCGGSDPLTQQREQWTDGANALALAPGVIVLYDRNLETAEELDRHSFRIVHADDVLLGREQVRLEDDGRVCLLLPSHEMSRARGGPHCLTHPLVREPVGR
jgi:arginine deiminase